MTIIDNPVKALNFIYFNNRNAVNNDWKWIETLIMFELGTVEAFRRALASYRLKTAGVLPAPVV